MSHPDVYARYLLLLAQSNCAYFGNHYHYQVQINITIIIIIRFEFSALGKTWRSAVSLISIPLSAPSSTQLVSIIQSHAKTKRNVIYITNIRKHYISLKAMPGLNGLLKKVKSCALTVKFILPKIAQQQRRPTPSSWFSSHSPIRAADLWTKKTRKFWWNALSAAPQCM